jgi:Polyketide cyclase / dehydrase and lipid transport
MKKEYTISKSVEIVASSAMIFMLMTDVEKWRLWTSSIRKIKLLNRPFLQEGAKAKVWQPRLLPSVWEVTEMRPGHSFTWVSKSPGLRMTAAHCIEEIKGRQIVRLEMIYEGVLAAFFYKLTAGLTKKYLEMEINGLKAACEKAPVISVLAE